MSSDKEIITLQFGHYSNFVGTHIWNIQEAYFPLSNGSYELDINHNVLFRSLQTKDGDTYEPRAVLFDLQGSFRAFNKGDELRETQETVDTWDEKVETYKLEGNPQNVFEQYQASLAVGTTTKPLEILESSVQVWSDFSKLLYHPKSLVQLPTYSHENETTPFALFGQGRELWNKNDFREDVIDNRIRFFLEECDSLQGFQILTNTNDGFGGLTSCVMEALLDDMPKATLITYGINEANSQIVNSLQGYRLRIWENLNQIHCLKHFKDSSSIYIPICSPLPSDVDPNGWSKYLRPKFHLRYHTSAYLASLIETASLPWRIYSNPLFMQEIASLLSSSVATKLAAIAAAIPLQGENLIKQGLVYNPKPGHKMTCFRDSTLCVGYDQVDFEIGQYAVLRGVGSHHIPEAQRLQTFQSYKKH